MKKIKALFAVCLVALLAFAFIGCGTNGDGGGGGIVFPGISGGTSGETSSVSGSSITQGVKVSKNDWVKRLESVSGATSYTIVYLYCELEDINGTGIMLCRETTMKIDTVSKKASTQTVVYAANKRDKETVDAWLAEAENSWLGKTTYQQKIDGVWYNIAEDKEAVGTWVAKASVTTTDWDVFGAYDDMSSLFSMYADPMMYSMFSYDSAKKAYKMSYGGNDMDMFTISFPKGSGVVMTTWMGEEYASQAFLNKNTTTINLPAYTIIV